ncbi:uncharacterized protein LOC119291036 isoform X2 [Triticum dicoccoides]|uniref:uncharacterized protein LOC119291036 isoform X2 n=1 Tax=Triticum dicoccoides TaxID=85692 RepID=UPI00188FCCFA|nr:uncharacterized protein LOC119291036 isoform X2 [Triticum dicoccoides]
MAQDPSRWLPVQSGDHGRAARMHKMLFSALACVVHERAATTAATHCTPVVAVVPSGGRCGSAQWLASLVTRQVQSAERYSSPSEKRRAILVLVPVQFRRCAHAVWSTCVCSPSSMRLLQIA